MSDPRAALAAGRAAHAALMVDACTVTRVLGRVHNEVSNTYSDTVTTVYTGPCRIVAWRGDDEPAAETQVNVLRCKVQMPFDLAAPVVQRRDTVTVTASTNPWLVGKSMAISEIQLKSTATALEVIGKAVS